MVQVERQWPETRLTYAASSDGSHRHCDQVRLNIHFISVRPENTRTLAGRWKFVRPMKVTEINARANPVSSPQHSRTGVAPMRLTSAKP